MLLITGQSLTGRGDSRHRALRRTTAPPLRYFFLCVIFSLIPTVARASGPVITSISPILPQPAQTITITGSGFGTLTPYNGDSYFIQIVDNTKPFSAGHRGDNPDDFVTLSISSWTDTQVVVSGFTGDYGDYNWTLSNGDNILINIWNAQTGAGPGNCSTVVGGASTSCGACAATPQGTCSPGAIQVRTTADTSTSAVTYLSVAPTAKAWIKLYQPKQLFVGCFDASGNPLPNCQITANIQVTSLSGGHNHDNGERPPGELVISADDLPNDDGSSLDYETVTVTTDGSGSPIMLTYLPPPIGGDVVAKLTASLNGQALPENDLKLYVRTPFADCPDPAIAGISALCDLSAVVGPNFYILTGGKPAHPSNHFGTSDFNETLPSIASDWFHVPASDDPVPPLAINDMSLIDGGVFDIGGEGKPVGSWTPPHSAHRWGSEADIGSGDDDEIPPVYRPITYWIPPDQRARLLEILANYDYLTIVEKQCNPSVSEAHCTHFHIRPVKPPVPAN